MDTSNEDENNIFGDQIDEINEYEEGTNNQNEEENEDEAIETNEQNEEDKKPVKAKRVIKNPRPTLNAECLKKPKGLAALDDCFKRVKFKGKGHEEEDLNVLLKTYEYWCHRLFPRLPFKDCIEKIEKLGTKGPIQTHLKKIRSGLTDEELPTTNELVQEDSSEDDNPREEVRNQSIIADIPVELTEEQLETIRRNREKAEVLRKERLRKIQEKASGLLESIGTKVGDNCSIEGRSKSGDNENEKIVDGGVNENKNIENGGVDEDENIHDGGVNENEKIDDGGVNENRKIHDGGVNENEEIHDGGVNENDGDIMECVDEEGETGENMEIVD